MIGKSKRAEDIQHMTNRILLLTGIEDPKIAADIARKWANA